MAWIDWVLIASITLLAAIIIRARLQRGCCFNKLDLGAVRMGSPGGYNELKLAVAPDNVCARQNPVEEAVSGGLAGSKTYRYLREALDGDTSSYCRRRFEQMKPLLGLPPTFGLLVEENGPYPRGHSQAVSWLAMQIARRVGLSETEIEEIRLGGLVHDIGKIHVPAHVLKTPTLLTPEEYEIMKSHAAWGAKMLEPLNLKAIERIVRHHHERYDGKGYPDGLAGDTIPLGARIVAVAECFEDMVSDLPYKSARTFEDALAELCRCSGTQFDPRVVAAFLGWLQIHGDPREQQ